MKTKKSFFGGNFSIPKMCYMWELSISFVHASSQTSSSLLPNMHKTVKKKKNKPKKKKKVNQYNIY